MSWNDEHSGQPALYFEQKHGLTDIAGRYNFPADQSHDFLLKKIFTDSGYKPLSDQEYRDLWEELKRLNPKQTSRIRFNINSPEEIQDVVNGIVSGFNPDDINLFITRVYAHNGLSAHVRREYTEAKIMQRLDSQCDFQWNASQETLDRILEQVKDRPVLRPFDVAMCIVKQSAVIMIHGATWAWRVNKNRIRTNQSQEREG